MKPKPCPACKGQPYIMKQSATVGRPAPGVRVVCTNPVCHDPLSIEAASEASAVMIWNFAVGKPSRG